MEPCDLTLIAAMLEGLEETIIAKFIDRAQFALNSRVYRPGQSGFTGESAASLFDLRLRYQEEMDSLFGRFEVPEERPFTQGLPAPRRQVHLPQDCLEIGSYDRVNLTPEIRRAYLSFVPVFCGPGDDGQYGSSVEHDVAAVQAVSRRIHFGAMYVAESKYRGNPAGYRELIEAGDREGIMQLLTRKEVEDRIIIRIAEKVAYAQERVNRRVRKVIEPEQVAGFYRDAVIPLTKKGEVRYLFARSHEEPSV